ncbi:UNVERIFIED_CONTAM: hypothetical protein Slati_3639500 [Sesamum latifolium]|uniref:DUF4216 domain-containing protein n=1 Tax=Sesamum latifolium TaxID=2727402 RepID=A0AAW2U137_9LAMI
MEHLIVHLPYDAGVGGPVQYRWISLFYLRDLKMKSIFNYPGRASGASKKGWLSGSECHIIDILTNCEAVTPYCELFLNELYEKYHPEDPIIEELVNTQFKYWFKRRVKTDLNYTDNNLLKLHYWGPTAETDTDFYGILKEIIQLDYPLIPNMQIVLFKCHWVDPLRRMKVHPHYHLVDVNFKKVYQKNESFILAQQAVQVYYTEYPSMKRDKVNWMVVCKIKARKVIDDYGWSEVAFQEDETIPTPQVVTDNHNYELHDPNGIQLVVDLSIANQQGASTSRSAHCESDDESDEDSFDEDYESNEDNNYN